MASGRPLNYYEFIGPVKTPDEQQLSHELETQHSSSTGRGVTDWTAFTRDWNLQAFANVASCGAKVITFKQVSHLKAYSTSLAKEAGQVHAAAMASDAGQLHQQSEDQHAGEQSDTPAVIADLQQILQECVQHHEGVLHLPAVLQQLLTQSLGVQSGPSLAAVGSSSDADAGAEPPTSTAAAAVAAAVAVAARRDNDGAGPTSSVRLLQRLQSSWGELLLCRMVSLLPKLQVWQL